MPRPGLGVGAPARPVARCPGKVDLIAVRGQRDRKTSMNPNAGAASLSISTTLNKVTAGRRSVLGSEQGHVWE